MQRLFYLGNLYSIVVVNPARRLPLILFPILSIVFLLFGCQKLPETAEEIQSEKDVAQFLDVLEKRYEACCIEIGRANWNLYSYEGPADPSAARAELADIFLNDVYRKIVNDWRFKINKDNYPELHRRLEIWSQCFIGAFIEEDEAIYSLKDSLMERNYQFRFSMDDQEVSRAELNRILRTDPDSERRRKAWEAFGQLSEAMESGLRDLMWKRNEKVELLGRQIDYAVFSLMVQAINAGWLKGLIDKLEERTREPYREFINSLKQELDIEVLYPWDIQYAMHQATSLPDEYFPADRAVPTLFNFVRSIGLSEDKVSIKIVEDGIPYDVCGTAIKIPNTYRLIVTPGEGHRFYSTLFHEYGRGLYNAHIRAKKPIFKGYEWVLGATSAAYTEGMAEILAEFPQDSLWLRKYTSLSEEQIERYANVQSNLELYSIRSLISTISFELEAYTNLLQDLDILQREMDRTFLLVDIPEDTPSQWASMTALVNYPLYYQNYFLAAVVAAQVHQTLKKEFGDRVIDSPEVGKWLIENLYAPGESRPWRDKIRQATGNWPDVDAYIERLVAETQTTDDD